MSVTHITACRLCDSPDLDLVVSFTPTPPGDHYVPADKWNEPQPCYPLDVVCCRACGAVQLADTVDPALIYPEYLYTTSVSKGLTEHYAQYADAVWGRVNPPEGARVLDIGSNDGTLLKQFELLGGDVLGVDPAKAIAEQATKDGIATECGFFTAEFADELREDYGQQDLITANHIMANVADLHDFIEGVKTLLAPDGTFVFETGYWPAIVDGTLIDTIEHEHIHYFAVAPLSTLFQRHGLELVHVEMNRAKGGSLRGFVQHLHVEDQSDTSVQIALQAERGGGYSDAGKLRTWTAELDRLRQALQAEIAQAQAETWIGYGAAVGSTLQLHHFGLGEKLEYLVDANPAKRGLLSPGYHLPVCSPEALKDAKVDRIVILAWRYAEMIMAQHPEFAGKWLIPLPTLRHA